MCGFLTYISACGDAARHLGALTNALETIDHRGPDQTGVHAAGDDAVLGFKRLSIIDVEHSDQPLSYAGRYTITFNGEIYNYLELREELIAEHGAEFATSGDTEVVAAAYHHWGPQAVHRLRGMFAFVIWDHVERLAFGARDRFGIKPLCYLAGESGAWFASEQKALRPFTTPVPDPVALSHYLTYQYVPEPMTLLAGIRQLGAGRCFTYSTEGELTIHRYWRPEFAVAPVAGDDPERRILDALSDSVAKHMRADVPVGSFLSSGIDSTAVAALAARHNPGLLTFTAALDVPGYSELDVAAASAEALGVRNHAVVVDAQMMMDALPRIVWHLDDPVADPALIPLYYVAREASAHVKVVLSGEGADELFAGYGIYREPRSLRPVTGLPPRVRRGLRSVAHALPEGVRGRSFLDRGTTTLAERYFGNARMFTEAEKRGLLTSYDPSVRYTDVTGPLFAEAAELGEVEQMQYIDLGTWLPGDILRKADRMSMANSLEVRVPFLDPEVFAAAAGLPSDLKLPPRSVQTKAVLRRALASVVPPAIVERKKLGFPTPIRVWLKDEMYEWAAGILRESGASELVDLSHGIRLLDAHRRGEADHSRKVWTLLVFALWYDITISGTRDPAPESARSTPIAPISRIAAVGRPATI
ncbi:MAG: hypothetical protein QOJ50_3407 [Cryptosporangiaceae bacterium]|nr:hypothetical protein [Cryptosporangiaceae bacterium]